MSYSYKSWPFEEAKRLLDRFLLNPTKKGFALFETGYGPSGLPHIGTFGEVLRTTMVRKAFEHISTIPTRLFCFSDDMDGLRKVPSNVPNQDLLKKNLNKPLTQVPDPFEQYESFGHHNNAMLRQFLDSFGFEYEFKSSTQYYQSGFFDPYLKNVLRHYDAIMQVMLPSLREERRKTYSPFLPICPQTNEVLQVPIEHYCLQKNTITYKDPVSNDLMTLPITGGHCKLQWKVDWGMRWSAFDVDYEMSGKDLIDSVKLSSKICRIIGGHVPQTLTYELFLDQKGEKISKSKGNGLSIDEWLTYAPQESLAYYMFQSPKKAKRLYFDVIPKACDEYLNHRANFAQASIDQASQASDASTGEVSDASIGQERFDTPIWHIHHQDTINHENSLSFSILLNLASVCNTQDPEVLWGFVKRYLPSATPTTMPLTDRLIQHAVQYFISFVKPYKQYRQPNPNEIVALHALHDRLKSLLSPNHLAPSANDIQHIVYEVGKLNNFSDLRTWFGTLYEVLLGQTDGPRIGSFIHLYGVEEFCALIRQHIN